MKTITIQEMIERKDYINGILEALNNFQVVALIGSRQSGKTTLARSIAAFSKANNQNVHYFDLEGFEDRIRLEDPKQTLEPLKGLVIIDEIQHAPNLFMFLRVLADRKPLPARFLILGSASGNLLKQSAESLAGRICYIELKGLNLNEVGIENLNKLWIRGSYPTSFLAEDDSKSFSWRNQFIQTYLERDMPTLGVQLPSLQLWRFWQMAAHYHGQIWSHSEIARSLGITVNTIKHYLDLLTETFMVKQIAPWFENISKRLVKSPKFYINDSGLLHTLLGIKDYEELIRHPKLGASWEGFAFDQILQATHQNRNAFYWATHEGAEIDLILILDGKKIGFEIKYAGAPTITASMRKAANALNLEKLYIIYPGTQNYLLDEKIEVLPLSLLWDKKNLLGH